MLSGALRPDVLITRVVERAGRLHFGTEVSWQREIVDAGTSVLAIVDRGAPCADAGPAAGSSRGADRRAQRRRSGRDAAPRVPTRSTKRWPMPCCAFVPDGARLQYGPGKLGTALLMRSQRPLCIDTGLLTDAVVDLERRGLLIGMPSATYLFGTQKLYEWADGKPILRGIDYTHDLTRLSRGAPLVAVNTAIEIDPFGQVNVGGRRRQGRRRDRRASRLLRGGEHEP